ncbi:response regulator transcription factor [Kordiimonas gwangyangensis]|uniref:response regulator transcription factor n=1 Tax=Kordiimonas gwangyangensis TaxID=288022 RepID=UPI00035F6941|nr:response regulator transcription factor [Kordiimonas gwangyangensis]
MNHTRVLIVEDNHAIAEQLHDYLSARQFVVDYADTGRQALALVEAHDFDVIVLDLMLPDADGIDLCAQLKAKGRINMPVLMLTARDSLADKGEGFAAGADDYLTKPFELAEVAMRCQALARRHQLHRSATITIGDLVIDPGKRLVTRAGQVIDLSATDYAILAQLADAYPNAVSRNELVAKVWGDDFPDSDALRSHIYTLRKAVDKAFGSAMIKTIHGIGFKLDAGSEAEA